MWKQELNPAESWDGFIEKYLHVLCFAFVFYNNSPVMDILFSSNVLCSSFLCFSDITKLAAPVPWKPVAEQKLDFRYLSSQDVSPQIAGSPPPDLFILFCQTR